MKSGKRKYVIAIIIAFLLALVMEYAIHAGNPPHIRYEFDGAVQHELFPADLTSEGYDIAGDTYTPLDEDPRLFLDFPDGGLVSSVRVLLREPLAEQMELQAYLRNADGLYSVENARISYAEPGSTEAVIDIVPGEYPQIRLDLNGEFTLDRIQSSAQPTTKVVYPEAWSIPRLLVLFAVLSVLFILLLYFHVFCKIKRAFITAFHAIRTHPKQTRKVVFVTAGIIAALCVLVYAGLGLLGKSPEPVFFGFAAAFGFALSMFILFFKYTRKKPEYFFLAIFIPAALFISCAAPTTLALMSWDDNVHYEEIQNLSYFGEDAKMTLADFNYINRFYSPRTFSVEEQDAIYAQMEDQYSEGAFYLADGNGLEFNKLSYLPSSIVLFLGRMLGGSFHGLIIAARIAILLVFALLCFLAIRKLKSGKLILILIALFPTNVFLAANLSYDPWLTGFTMLGFAWFFSECQEPDKLLSTKNWIIMLGALFVGMAPKAIYFPLVALLFFLPKTKFASRKTHAVYLLTVLGTFLALLLSFLLPLFTEGVGMGDLRGGTSVNATEQVAYILANPLTFAQTMLGYLPLYLAVGNMQMFTTSFAYLGDGSFYLVLLILLVFVAFTDRNKFDRFTTTIPHKIRTLADAFITVVCVATVMYVSFTPVGHHTVEGCQARYLMPVIFPVLYVIGSKYTFKKMNWNVYNTAVFSIAGLILFFNIGYMIVGRYFLYN